jgi:hypothetical protein
LKTVLPVVPNFTERLSQKQILMSLSSGQLAHQLPNEKMLEILSSLIEELSWVVRGDVARKVKIWWEVLCNISILSVNLVH